MKKQPNFRTPQQIKEAALKEKGTQFSLRVSHECRETLEKASAKGKMGYTTLAAKVLEDYAAWLRETGAV